MEFGSSIFGNAIFSPGAAALGAALAGLCGLVVWWLVRKRQTRVWLPTIRIMQLETRVLPRLVLRPPPWLPFLCYLVAALVLLGFTLRPRTQVFTPFEPNQTRIHIFADMSPSVGGQVGLEDYVARVAALYRSLQEGGRITVSTSHGPEASEPKDEAALTALLRGRGLHRGGVRLGSALKPLTQDLGAIDRLFIVSDRDQHSWTGFNWQYLLDDMDVTFVDLATVENPRNLFLSDARFASPPAGTTMVWDVEIARRGPLDQADGQLVASYQGTALAAVPYQMPSGKQRLTVRIEWPVTALPAGSQSVPTQDDPPLVFQLQPASADALAADNELRTELQGQKRDVLLVSETAGERALEDPAGQLAVALQIQGFRLDRYDFVTQPGPAAGDYPLVVLIGGTGSGVDRFCPAGLLASKGAASTASSKPNPSRRKTKVWLAPVALDADYQELCECYARLTGVEGKGAEFCANVTSRSQWAGLLPSLGARQIGGELGAADQAFAWMGQGRASAVGRTEDLEVLAFTVPLTPLRQTGINHAQMPVLVKQLLTWQQLLDQRSGGGWPRNEDIAAHGWQDATAPGATTSAVRSTNVPVGESLMAEMDGQVLPPRWSPQMDWADKQLPVKKDREDPLPWLKLAAWLMFAVIAIEAIATLGYRLAGWLLRRPGASSTVALLLLLCLSTRAFGKVSFNLAGYNDPGLMLSALARDVSHRTSIELAARPRVFAKVQLESLAEPWLWVQDAALLSDRAGRLLPDVAQWLQRGGFLVIEAPVPTPQLERLTQPLRTAVQDGWQPLPPDHELMRSFYLLDALPSCHGQTWRGFHYDGRLAILVVPYGLLASLKDRGSRPPCENPPEQERSVRIFVNLVMVALATDYKKDQIHLPEILKRLR